MLVYDRMTKRPAYNRFSYVFVDNTIQIYHITHPSQRHARKLTILYSEAMPTSTPFYVCFYQ